MELDISEAASQWLDSLKKIGMYGGRVGDIVLSEQETQELALYLKRRVPEDCNNFDDHSAAVLAVAIVNLTYYYYEGAGGEAFLKYIIPQGYAVNAEVVGPRIERFLLDYKLISEANVGPYKYVGQFLRQAIITKHYLPQLIYYLKRFKNLIGLEKFNNLIYGVYLDNLEWILRRQHFNSGVFLETLKTPDGFNFIKSVANYLDQYRSRQIKEDELKDLPGFRDGFWEEIIKVINEPESDGFNPIYSFPFFGYNVDTERVGIYFDSSGIGQHAFKLFLNGRCQLVDKTFFSFTSEEQLHSIFKIHINKNEYQLRSWAPDEDSFYQVLLNIEDGRLVSCINHKKNILDAGHYYLITKGEMDEETASSFGIENPYLYESILDLDGESSYSVWTIELKPGMSLDALGKCPDHEGTFGLQWESTKYLYGTNISLGIFVGKMPRICIRGWKNFYNQFYIVLKYKDESEEVIETDIIEFSGADAFFSLPENPWKAGKLTLKPKGYTTVRPSCSFLNFLLLPNGFRVSWPFQLIGVDESPVVEIASEKDLQLEWTTSPEEVANKNGNISKYHFAPGVEMVSASSLQNPELKFNFRFNIAQAYPLAPPSKSSRQILWYGVLEESFEFIVYGHWKCPIQLGLKSGDSIHSVWENTTEGKRKVKISSQDLKDGISSYRFHIGRFCVKYEEKWKNTDCYLLNENGVEELILEMDRSAFLAFDTFPDDELGQIFIEAIKAIEDGNKDFKLSEVNIPDRLYNFLLFLECGKKVFDQNSKEYLFNNDRYQSIPFAEWIKWFSQCYSRAINPVDALKLRPEEQCGIPVDRWKSKIDCLIKNCRALSDVEQLLKEWEQDIISPYNSELSSKIGRMEAGNRISLAAHAYRKKSFKDVIKYAYEIKQTAPAANKPVKILACIMEGLAKTHYNKKIILKTLQESTDDWDRLLFQAKLFFDYYRTRDKNLIKGKDFSLLLLLFFMIKESEFSEIIQREIAQ